MSEQGQLNWMALNAKCKWISVNMNVMEMLCHSTLTYEIGEIYRR